MEQDEHEGIEEAFRNSPLATAVVYALLWFAGFLVGVWGCVRHIPGDFKKFWKVK